MPIRRKKKNHKYPCKIQIHCNEMDEEPPVTEYSWSFFSHGKEIAVSPTAYISKSSAVRSANRFMDSMREHLPNFEDIPFCVD